MYAYDSCFSKKTLKKGQLEDTPKDISKNPHTLEFKIDPQFPEDQFDALLTGRGDNEQPK